MELGTEDGNSGRAWRRRTGVRTEENSAAIPAQTPPVPGFALTYVTAVEAAAASEAEPQADPAPAGPAVVAPAAVVAGPETQPETQQGSLAAPIAPWTLATGADTPAEAGKPAQGSAVQESAAQESAAQGSAVQGSAAQHLRWAAIGIGVQVVLAVVLGIIALPFIEPLHSE